MTHKIEYYEHISLFKKLKCDVMFNPSVYIVNSKFCFSQFFSSWL